MTVGNEMARPLPASPWRRHWAAHAALLAAYLVLAYWASQTLALEDPPVALLWPATGLGLAFVFRFGYSLLLPLAAASLVVQTGLGADPAPAVIVTAGQVAAAGLGAFLLARFGFSRELGRVKDVLLLIAVGAGAGGAVSATAGALAIAGLSTGFPQVLGLCWTADLMGVLLFAPVVFTASPSRWVPERLETRAWESAAWIVLAPALTYLVYSGHLPASAALPLSYAVFPVIIAVALRRPPAIVAVALMGTAGVALMNTATGQGPFTQAGPPIDILVLHAQLALLAVTGLIIGAMRVERRAAEERAHEHLHALARAARLNAMGTMAAGIAHEINQPLCALSSYAHAAQRQLRQGAGADEVAATLERIAAGADRAASIVRRTRGLLVREPASGRPIDPQPVVREAVNLLEPEAARRGINLDFGSTGGPLKVDIDPVELQQVVVNLVQNAMEAITTGDAPGRPHWVRIVLVDADPPGTVALVVTDSGPGLPAGERGELFEPLVSRRPGGTGLGLAIARSIVDACGGTIAAANTRGAGAEFRVRLPAAIKTEEPRGGP